jgi:hypothetical protein
MANEWQYMNTVNGWDRVDSAVTAKAEEAPELVISLPALREKAQRVRFLFAQLQRSPELTHLCSAKVIHPPLRLD